VGCPSYVSSIVRRNASPHTALSETGRGIHSTALAWLLVRVSRCRILGYRLRKLSSWEYNRMFMFQPKTISTVTFLLGGVFATRCIFNFLTLAGVFNVDIGCVH